MQDATPQGSPGGTGSGHEETNVSARGLVIGTIVLVITVIVCQVGLGLWMREFNRKEDRVDAVYAGRHAIEVDQFPQPRLQSNPTIDMVELRREEQARISSYGWVDRKAGIARIPIDRAMEILAEKGLPRVAAPPPAPDAPPNTTIPPAGKREEAGPAEDQPRSPKKDDRPRPDSKQGTKP